LSIPYASSYSRNGVVDDIDQKPSVGLKELRGLDLAPRLRRYDVTHVESGLKSVTPATNLYTTREHNITP